MKDNKYIGEECRRCGEVLRCTKSTKCVACASTRYKRWYAKNKEALQERSKTWYKENKARARQTNAAWQRGNMVKLNTKARKRYAENPEHVLAVNKKWRDSDDGKKTRQSYEKSRYRHIQLAQYGLTVDDYSTMLTAQQGQCAICGSFPGSRKLAVDHCHETGKVRGLLCGKCNMGLGLFKDKQSLLSTAIKYLQNSEEAE